MIMSYKDGRAEDLFQGMHVAGLPPDIQRVAMRKLKVLHNAVSLNDLRVPPGNRLEILKGNRAGHQQPMADMLRLERRERLLR